MADAVSRLGMQQPAVRRRAAAEPPMARCSVLAVAARARCLALHAWHCYAVDRAAAAVHKVSEGGGTGGFSAVDRPTGSTGAGRGREGRAGRAGGDGQLLRRTLCFLVF